MNIVYYILYLFIYFFLVYDNINRIINELFRFIIKNNNNIYLLRER